MRRFGRNLAIFVTLATLVGCDHATKYVAKSELEGRGPLAIWGSWLELRYTENRDIAFNLLRFIPEAARQPLMLGLGGLALCALAATLVRMNRARAPWLASAGLVLVLGGAIGNYSDRVARGYVVDFIHARHWPVFNMADVWVSVGIALFLLASLRSAAPPSTTAPPTAA